MKQTKDSGVFLLLSAAVVSLSLLSGPVALAGEPAKPGAKSLAGQAGNSNAALLLPAVQAAREAAAAKGRSQGQTKKPGDKKPDDIAWPVPICKPGPGCPP